MLEKARYIVVEGPIGAGKTSLARRLTERLAAKPILEQPELNPFLARFYQDMERWAFPTQLSFLYQRIDQLAFLHAEDTQRIVSDFLLDKDPLFAGLNLGDDELALYRRLFDSLKPRIAPAPDLVVYLQAKPETLVERVRKRGLEAERRISETYLEKVADSYARFFYEYQAAPVFIVDAEILNPADHEEDFELLVERLRNMRSFREFFGYAA
ncbi:deoxynucleoside kinase [Cognatazoarcus halotolerans]|uniref:deoxynucleoside kinase n=1 Tax=Cognatazoarcus halotolerans TaxID=2686016 RepID=UPI00135AA560|nr:deoxynucleoside kinase [Cognatazoarcus halotolerans]MBX3680684.1 deoxynucleoside kinase [Rhodocyclaceae bacterium]MCB1901914.1 deoxynucleoside kinase [Rhodocyclaceae bacterium]MCP5310988.1 deoxynucleoside kinase [Zoogloeaceae bacterium]